MNCDCCNKPGTTSLRPTKDTCNCVFVCDYDKGETELHCIGHDEPWIKTYNQSMMKAGGRPLTGKDLKELASVSVKL